MLDCTTNNYATLYARWLEKPGALLDWGGYDPEVNTLLDLCGGTGAVSCAALERGGDATLVDLNPRCSDHRVRTICRRAEDLGPIDLHYEWDFVVCRQALSYLDLPRTSLALYRATVPGAVFICNTFVRPKWSFKSYEFEGRPYLEASGFLGKRVYHLQAMPWDFDVTAFRWYSVEEILTAFRPWWKLEKLDETSTTLKFGFKRKA